MNVIGNKGTSDQRMNTWLTMLESKKSYNIFKNSNDPQYQNIAAIDGPRFQYWLEAYASNS